MHRLLAGLFVVLALVHSGAAAAQEAALRLTPGERIFIAAPTLDRRLVPATVAHWEPGWLAFSMQDGQVWTRHMHDVDEIRVRRQLPTSSRMRRGMAWGLFLGTSLGGISAPFVALQMEGENDELAVVGMSAAAGAVVGTGVGALMGALVPRSRWEHYVFRPAAR